MRSSYAKSSSRLNYPKGLSRKNDFRELAGLVHEWQVLGKERAMPIIRISGSCPHNPHYRFIFRFSF